MRQFRQYLFPFSIQFFQAAIFIFIYLVLILVSFEQRQFGFTRIVKSAGHKSLATLLLSIKRDHIDFGLTNFREIFQVSDQHFSIEQMSIG